MNKPSSEVKQPEAERLTKEAYLELARTLSERVESFPFGGFAGGAYQELKKAEEEYPGCTTPIDVLKGRFVEGGIKVALGRNPKSGNVHIMPFERQSTDDVQQDSIMPRHLKVTPDMDADLQKLVLYHQSVFASQK